MLLGINYHWSISWEYSLDPWTLVLDGRVPSLTAVSLSACFIGNKYAKRGMPLFIKLILHCNFWGCHCSDYEVNCLLGCDTISFGRCLLMLRGTCCPHHQEKCQYIPFQTSECHITEDSHCNWYINEAHTVLITQKCSIYIYTHTHTHTHTHTGIQMYNMKLATWIFIYYCTAKHYFICCIEDNLFVLCSRGRDCIMWRPKDETWLYSKSYY